MNEKLENLEKEYRHKQQEIVDKRKNGEFATKEDDIKEQDRVWRNFLIDRWKITNSEKHRRSIIDYYKGKAMFKYVKLRDGYYTKKISLSEYMKKRKDIVVAISGELKKIGAIQDIKTQTINKQLNLLREEEKKVFKKRGNKISKLKISLACKKQTPLADEYYDNL